MAKVVKRKILVEVGYYDYHFDDLIAANAFAMVAKTHLSDEDSGRGVKMIVDYEVEEQEEDKEEEQEEVDKEVVYTDTDSVKINDEDIEEEQDDQTTD